jgi:hypothetical protein
VLLSLLEWTNRDSLGVAVFALAIRIKAFVRAKDKKLLNIPKVEKS